MSLGQKIRTTRESRGLTRDQLAELLDVSSGTIFNWEDDRNRPSEEFENELQRWLRNDSKVQPNNQDSDFTEEESYFSKWLRKERERKGLTREALAKLTDLSTQAIYQIETGRVRNPWRQTRDRLMSALGQTSLPVALQAELDEETEIEGGEEFHDFMPWSESSIPKSQCVYVYYDRTDRPIYVGETQNLRIRNR